MSILKDSDLFVSNESITAQKINNVKQKIEDSINGVIDHTFFDEKITTEKIRPGRFFGSPSPRAELVSGDIHYRTTFTRSKPKAYRAWSDISQDWEPIPGLAVTCHVVPQTAGLISRAQVLCNFSARDIGGGENTTDYTENKRHTMFGLWVKSNNEPPVFIANTLREIMCSTINDYLWASRNIAIQAVVNLQHGINHIYIAQQNVLGKSSSGASKSDGGRLAITSRSMVVDVQYL